MAVVRTDRFTCGVAVSYTHLFTEAVELLTGEKGAAQPPDRPCPASLSDFRLPPPNSDNRTARNYLTAVSYTHLEQQHTEPKNIFGELCQRAAPDQYPALHRR